MNSHFFLTVSSTILAFKNEDKKTKTITMLLWAMKYKSQIDTKKYSGEENTFFHSQNGYSCSQWQLDASQWFYVHVWLWSRGANYKVITDRTDQNKSTQQHSMCDSLPAKRWSSRLGNSRLTLSSQNSPQQLHIRPWLALNALTKHYGTSNGRKASDPNHMAAGISMGFFHKSLRLRICNDWVKVL